MKELEAPLAADGAAPLVREHQTLYDQTAQMVAQPARRGVRPGPRAGPPSATAYGRSAFGQGCLMARRLVEAGVTFVEVQSTGWDTHGNELPTLEEADPARGPGDGGAGRRPEGPRPAGPDAGDLDGRVRPAAADQPDRRPRPLSRRRSTWPWPAPACKGGRVIGATDADGVGGGRAAGDGAGPVLHLLPGPGHQPAAGEPEQRRPAAADRRGRPGGRRRCSDTATRGTEKIIHKDCP